MCLNARILGSRTYILKHVIRTRHILLRNYFQAQKLRFLSLYQNEKVIGLNNEIK
jgi:hypothetical protein